MKLTLIVIATFMSAFLGCLQVINLARQQRLMAMLTSVGISLSQLTLLKVVPTVDHWSEGLGFVVAGLIGAQCSMWVGNHIKK